MSPSQNILVYAELLSNIRQISVGCTLSTPASSATRATIAAEGQSLTIAHDGVSKSIELPGRVPSTLQLPIQKIGATVLSWRLPLASPTTGRVLPGSEESVPWSAKDLEPGSAVTCRTCNTIIVDAGTLHVWKDLPSENWAEMMEFWHCHKPHHHKQSDDEQHLTDRGYGASSRIVAQPGVGFVDLTSFFLADSDVLNSSISTPVTADGASDDSKEEAQSGTSILNCRSCKTQVGVRSDQVSSISLFKWQVHVNQQKPNNLELSPDLAECVSAMLLATMARSGCSKSIIIPMEAQSSPALNGSNSRGRGQSQSLLNIWVFNANIAFSSTEAPKSPINAIKVFYRTVTREEADKMLESMTSDVQDISLPTKAITSIIDLLDTSNTFVPPNDRKFKEWTVGLLEKWDSKGG